jgi:hypothetical protein
MGDGLGVRQSSRLEWQILPTWTYLKSTSEVSGCDAATVPMSTRPAGIVLGVLEARCAYAVAGGYESEPVNSSNI